MTMPDTRKHRGPHPQDAQLFGRDVWPVLRTAVGDLSWLLSRGYATDSSLKLVGDRFQLVERQRIAVMRCSCPDDAVQHRQRTRLQADLLAGRNLAIDGFNVLTSIEAALAGGVILAGRDGCFRDMASMHGSYRRVFETLPALIMIGEFLQQLDVKACCWYLDRPVSNSGRLKKIIETTAAERSWPWTAELPWDVDTVLIETDWVVATADCRILDACSHWFNLARMVIESRVREPNLARIGVSGG
jgi:hypothetical protein